MHKVNRVLRVYSVNRNQKSIRSIVMVSDTGEQATSGQRTGPPLMKKFRITSYPYMATTPAHSRRKVKVGG